MNSFSNDGSFFKQFNADLPPGADQVCIYSYAFLLRTVFF